MARHDNLASTLAGGIAQYLIDLTLAQDLEMRVGLVNQQHGFWIAQEIG